MYNGFIVFRQIDSIHVLLRIVIIAVASQSTSNTRSYVSFQRLTANIIKRLLIAQVSGKVVIKEESYSIFLYHFVVSDKNLIDSTSAFSYSKRTKFSKDMWNVNFGFIAGNFI
jgi:hypothetical protein